ncbi:hypothetical protein WCLP8_4830008 [uncultured Gammaproteobacteria bacterium]
MSDNPDTRSLIPFEFGGKTVRIVLQGGEPWFVAADVCAVLGLSNVTMALEKLDLNWGENKQLRADGNGEIGPGGIFVAEYEIKAQRLFDPVADGFSLWNTWELFGLQIKAMVGFDGYGGGDPLVLDLDGNGIEATPFNSITPRFDIDGDLYAEKTALAGPHEGMLARDLNGDGKINDARELFGLASVSGFSVLATLDGNHDGTVDAADDGLADFNGDGVVDGSDSFGTLRVWRDANQNATTDAGELIRLAEAGIVSLAVTPTPAAPGTLVNGSRLDATAAFTRADGSTGTIGQVVFRTNNMQSTYVGPAIEITEEALGLPDLYASGTLVTLRQAMSLRPESAAAVRAARWPALLRPIWRCCARRCGRSCRRGRKARQCGSRTARSCSARPGCAAIMTSR